MTWQHISKPLAKVLEDASKQVLENSNPVRIPKIVNRR